MPSETTQPKARAAGRVRTGETLPARELVTIADEPVAIPDPSGFVHLQLRRFAGCPVCNLHLRSIVLRHDDIVAAGVREVVVFHSTREDLLEHAADLPFAIVSDPDKRLYRELGAETGWRAMADPRAWPAIARGTLLSLWGIVRHRRRSPSIFPEGGRYGLPADILIGPDGVVVASKYGEHVYDQWSVDELLRIAAGARR